MIVHCCEATAIGFTGYWSTNENAKICPLGDHCITTSGVHMAAGARLQLRRKKQRVRGLVTLKNLLEGGNITCHVIH